MDTLVSSSLVNHLPPLQCGFRIPTDDVIRGSSLSSSNHEPQRWAANFEGTTESYNFDDEIPQILPNHLLGTTPQIEGLRPKR